MKIAVALGQPTDEIYPVTLLVEDTGRGIPADKLDRIFEHFYQVDFSDNREHGGTGLGLAITHSLVTLMGGHISVTSTVGVGSCFTVALYLVKAAATPVTAPCLEGPIAIRRSAVIPAGEDGPVQVLIVDGNQVNRMLLGKMLENLEIGATQAANGQEAVDAVLQAPTRFDLVLMDLQMPVMGGLEATQIIRKNVGEDLTIVALTAAAQLPDREASRLAGMNDFLTKPIDRKVLLSLMMRVGFDVQEVSRK